MKHYDNHNILKKRCLLDEQNATEILSQGEYGVISMVETLEGGSQGGYGVPINFAWDEKDYIYMHCAIKGHKLECIDATPRVSLCVVGAANVVSEEFTTTFQSIVVRGRVSRNLTAKERLHALKLIVAKYSPAHKAKGVEIAERLLHCTEVLRLEIDTISGKDNSLPE